MTNYVHPETLVDTQWLADNLNNPNVRILEIDLKAESYQQEHIPNSIFFHGMLPFTPEFRFNFEPQAMSKLLGSFGITNETTIVTVHNSYMASSGAIFWLLKVFGHEDVRILNGGFPKWKQDGYPLTSEETVVTTSQYEAKSPDESLRITLPDLQRSLSKCCTLLDVRTPQEYRGEIFMSQPPTKDERGGHIPSAVHLYYELLHNEDGTFKSFDQLQEIFQQYNILPHNSIIPYCAVGARAGHVWYILKYLLGYPHVQNYDGSWNEWSRIPELSISVDDV